jgi:hypothetical protein
MPRPCKIIESKFRAEIEALARQGYSPYWISNWCRDKGSEISARAIGRYLDKVGIPQSGKATTYDKTLQKGKSKTSEEVEPSPIVVDVDGLLNRFGITGDLTTADGVFDAVQKLTAQLTLLEGLITFSHLEAYAKGEAKHPNEQLRGFRIAFEAFKSAWGMEQAVNLSEAMRTLETAGYQISAMKVIEENKNPGDSLQGNN